MGKVSPHRSAVPTQGRFEPRLTPLLCRRRGIRREENSELDPTLSVRLSRHERACHSGGGQRCRRYSAQAKSLMWSYSRRHIHRLLKNNASAGAFLGDYIVDITDTICSNFKSVTLHIRPRHRASLEDQCVLVVAPGGLVKAQHATRRLV